MLVTEECARARHGEAPDQVDGEDRAQAQEVREVAGVVELDQAGARSALVGAETDAWQVAQLVARDLFQAVGDVGLAAVGGRFDSRDRAHTIARTGRQDTLRLWLGQYWSGRTTRRRRTA